MWTSRCENLTGHRGLRYSLEHAKQPATFADVLCGWHEDAAFRSWFNSMLADSPYTAFRWETPPVTAATQSQAFEFVLLDSPGLARRPEPEAFAEHFQTPPATGVVTFSNLGGDAIMSFPAPWPRPRLMGTSRRSSAMLPCFSSTRSGKR